MRCTNQEGHRDMDQGYVNLSSGFAKTNIYFDGWWWEGLAYPHFVWDGKKLMGEQ